MDIDNPVGVLHKTSFVDFPGRVASAVFLYGCNLRCPYCYNHNLVDNIPPLEEMVSCKDIVEHLNRRRNVFSGFVLSGGEPLLSPAAVFLAAEAKKSGYDLKLDTNGTLPDKLKYFFCNKEIRPDFIALDIKTSLNRYNLLNPRVENAGLLVQETIRLLESEQPQMEFRTVLVPELITKNDILQIASCLPKDAVWKLARFRQGECLDKRFNTIIPYTEKEYQDLLDTAVSVIPGTELR